jgi:basic membrane lipoprotein Med (substrate-binding protein (PBP1-ABC) superfamily)
MNSDSNKRKGLIAAVVIVIIAIGIYIVIHNPFAPLPAEFVENPYDVAIVFATGGFSDKSFNDGCKKGADDAVIEIGIDCTYVEPTAITEYAGFIRSYAEHTGYDEPSDLIISIGFDQADAVMAVVEDYPNQYIAIVDTSINPRT